MQLLLILAFSIRILTNYIYAYFSLFMQAQSLYNSIWQIYNCKYTLIIKNKTESYQAIA